MPEFRRALASLWTTLNPREPSAHFLAAFYIGALVLFGVAFVIGYH